jgi:hypothetical protein
MDGVRDWRLRKPGTHTREVQTEVRVESLPKDVQELLLEMADEINKLKNSSFEQANRIDALESVSLNDLIKRSA